MSHYADYVKERLGYETIEWEDGFVTYFFSGTACIIHDLYVVPSERRLGVGSLLADHVVEKARERGCKVLGARVYLDSINPTEALKAHLGYGLQLHGTEDGAILLSKAIGE